MNSHGLMNSCDNDSRLGDPSDSNAPAPPGHVLKIVDLFLQSIVGLFEVRDLDFPFRGDGFVVLELATKVFDLLVFGGELKVLLMRMSPLHESGHRNVEVIRRG